MATEAQTKMLLTVEEAVELLGIGRTLGWRLVQEGKLPSVRLGRCVRMPKQELEAWVSRQAREDPRGY